MASFLRSLVSQKQRRLDGLDLSFINSGLQLERRLVAFSFPADPADLEAWWRNSSADVRAWLEARVRGGGSYRVYNLAAERPYGPERLGGSLACGFGFEDHQVPTLAQMRAFAEDVGAHLDSHPRNLAAVHCKAGKGRTGLMVCAFLLHRGLAGSAQAAMDTYGRQRSTTGAGITMPSQQRYVRYFEAALRDPGLLVPAPLLLERLAVAGFSGRCLAELTVRVSGRDAAGQLAPLAELAASPAAVRRQPPARAGGRGRDVLELRGECVLAGDVRIEVCRGRRLLFRAWLNTSFVSAGAHTLRGRELDQGDGSVRPGAELQLHFLDRCGSAADGRQASGDLAVLQPHASLPPCAHAGKAGAHASPARSPQTVLSPCTAPSSPAARLFDVHPDFGVPAGICVPPPPLATPFSGAFGGRPLSRASSGSRSSRSLPEAASQEPGLLDPPAEGPARAQRALSVPPAARKARSTPPLRSLSLVRLRGGGWGEEPELPDVSAPTTPSLPRPFDATFDWHRDAWAREVAQLTALDTGRSDSGGLPAGGWASCREGAAGGPDSPSHGARLIKWMSASWWMDLA